MLLAAAGQDNEIKQSVLIFGLLAVAKYDILRTDTRSSVGRMLYVDGFESRRVSAYIEETPNGKGDRQILGQTR